jgi:hypothetical protein
MMKCRHETTAKYAGRAQTAKAGQQSATESCRPNMRRLTKTQGVHLKQNTDLARTASGVPGSAGEALRNKHRDSK